MNFKNALRYPFQDAGWLPKVLVGTLIMLVPILNFVALGFLADVVRNVSQGRETPMPTWDDFGGLFTRGFFMLLVQLLWSLPLLILACPMIGIIVLTGAASGDEPGAAFFLVLGCSMVLLIAIAIVIGPFMLAAQARYAATQQFAAAMPGPVVGLVRANARPWIIAYLFNLALNAVIGVLALPLAITIIGIILLFPLAFYQVLALAHWQGQALRQTQGGYALPRSMV